MSVPTARVCQPFYHENAYLARFILYLDIIFCLNLFKYSENIRKRMLKICLLQVERPYLTASKWCSVSDVLVQLVSRSLSCHDVVLSSVDCSELNLV